MSEGWARFIPAAVGATVACVTTVIGLWFAAYLYTRTLAWMFGLDYTSQGLSAYRILLYLLGVYALHWTPNAPGVRLERRMAGHIRTLLEKRR
jgi:hypothetical protein